MNSRAGMTCAVETSKSHTGLRVCTNQALITAPLPPDFLVFNVMPPKQLMASTALTDG